MEYKIIGLQVKAVKKYYPHGIIEPEKCFVENEYNLVMRDEAANRYMLTLGTNYFFHESSCGLASYSKVEAKKLGENERIALTHKPVGHLALNGEILDFLGMMTYLPVDMDLDILEIYDADVEDEDGCPFGYAKVFIENNFEELALCHRL